MSSTEYGVLVSYPGVPNHVVNYHQDEATARGTMHSINCRDTTRASASLVTREVGEWQPEPAGPTVWSPFPPGYHQCAAITLKGVRCRRLVSEGWIYCGSHKHLRATLDTDEKNYR